MEHVYSDKVYYADTDAYGVVWHGAYLRMMEKGRVLFCDELGLDLVTLKEQDIVIPVTNINIKYKSSAKIDERYSVKTSVSKKTPLSITFHQIIENTETGKIYTEADVTVVAVNGEGKLYRRLPEILANSIQEDELCSV